MAYYCVMPREQGLHFSAYCGGQSGREKRIMHPPPQKPPPLVHGLNWALWYGKCPRSLVNLSLITSHKARASWITKI